MVVLALAGRAAEPPPEAPAPAAGEAAAVAPAAAVARSDPGSFQTQTTELGISPNEPVYFSIGFNEKVNAKFQLSLKFRPFGATDDSIKGEHVWNDLYLAYTQTSIWDLESESKPFFDTSYRPSIFYQRRDIGELFGGRFSLRGGFEHESNGKGGADSRSINILFIRPSWWWEIDRRWAVAFSPKAYTYLEKSENPDIAEYRGYVDWQVTLAQNKGIRLTTTFRVGTEGHSSVLADFSYPFEDITPLRAIGLQHGYLHIQYFNGYGETILAYDRQLPWQLRVGLMIVR
ncbi:MAG: phospholipase A [Opitutaceae bacterium]|nr:phospholipase A [Opitutaceae bacterium]